MPQNFVIYFAMLSRIASVGRYQWRLQFGLQFPGVKNVPPVT